MFARAWRKEEGHERSLYEESGWLGLLMAKVPDIVWSRLALKTPPNSAVHPDANLLAAFAEHALLERERVAVLAHLMECADCRQSLALACTSTEPAATPAAALPIIAGFHEWRWIVSAATACCVAATALLYYSKPPALALSARVAPKPAESPVVQMVVPEPAESAAPIRLARKQKVESPSGGKTGPALLALKKELARQDVLMRSVPPTVISPSAAKQPGALLPVGMDGPQADAVSAFTNQEPTTASPTAPPQPVPPAGSAGMLEAKRLPGVPQAAFAKGTPLSIAGLKSITMNAAAAIPQVLWSINASPDTSGNARGVVQRSTDAGQSWQTVPLSEHVSFRAVATLGPEVWAGGSEGTLFHSRDSGSRWAMVKVAGETSDIVSIDPRPNLLTITAASGEVWISTDRGKHWKRE